MANIPGFLSPRCDFTVRSVPPDKLEALMAAVCDILCEKPGDRVEFATSAIYENVQEVVEPEIPTMRQCNKTYRHPRHRWFYGADHVTCPGISVETHTHG